MKLLVRIRELNWTHSEIDYLVSLTGVDCVRLHGLPEPHLRRTAQKVHAKLKILQGGPHPQRRASR
jgi:hypothetical protein